MLISKGRHLVSFAYYALETLSTALSVARRCSLMLINPTERFSDTSSANDDLPFRFERVGIALLFCFFMPSFQRFVQDDTSTSRYKRASSASSNISIDATEGEKYSNQVRILWAFNTLPGVDEKGPRYSFAHAFTSGAHIPLSCRFQPRNTGHRRSYSAKQSVLR
ncbi:hypothetical protein C8J56DRAFT_346886 [Mycena floridula]|nr:hypothetical protein C8J56DRAFT_346886 [Mycena floridula]